MKREHSIVSYDYKTEQAWEYIQEHNYDDICPICQESLSNGSSIVHMPNCMHPLHKHCYKDMLKKYGTNCPTCKVDTTYIRRDIDHNTRLGEPEIRKQEIPNSNVVCRYIEDHQCHAITNRGWRCTRRGIYDGYCGTHS